MPPKKETETISVKPGALKGKKVIVTGDVEGQSRKSAEQILINAGATVEKSLNKKVELVVLGQKGVGQNKIDKAEELGVETKEWDDLIEEIKGESGAEPAGAADEEDEMEDENEAEESPKPQKGKANAKAAPKANTKAKADPAPKAKVKANVSSDNFLSGKTVIVTGTVPGHDRKSSHALLEEAGADVAKSLNKSVELVILGTNPGPDKMKKIEDLGLETIHWNEMAEKLGLEVTSEKEVADVKTGEAPDSIDAMAVIITGTVEGYTRSAAQKLLENAGATYAKSLNKSVELVVLGTNPGPDKLNKIADLGIATCSFEALVEKLGLEAEASEPPKKKAKKA